MSKKRHIFKYSDPEKGAIKSVKKEKGPAKQKEESLQPPEVVTSKRDLRQSFFAILFFSALLVLFYFINQGYNFIYIIEAII